MPSRIFVLSPAKASGPRAARFLARTAESRADSTVMTIEELFTFTSSLYFRGKIAYARRFAQAPPEFPHDGVFIIAPGFGLVAPTWAVDPARFQTLASTALDPRSVAYRLPLEQDARALAAGLPADAQVVLLGSLATGKYLDLLLPAFGPRLMAPRALVGTGDMQRGAILLRAAASGRELEYVSCSGLARAT